MNKTYFLLLLFPFLLSSCVKDISMAVDDRHVVVECVLSCNATQTLRLSYTVPEGSSLAPVEEATVILTDKQAGKEIGRFIKGESNLWSLDYSAEPAHSYRLDIDVPGFEHIFAEQTMPEQVDVRGRYREAGSWSSDLDLLKFGNEGFKGTVFQTYTLPAHTWICGLIENSTTGEINVADDILTDFPYIDNFNLTGEVFDSERESIAPYIYLNGFSKHRQYLRTTHSVVIPFPSDYWDGETREISMEDINASNFVLHGSFLDSDKVWISPDYDFPMVKGNVLFTATSEDYDKYLSESVYYQLLQESTDMTAIYIRDNIFSNITGGLGIFGAKTECACMCLYPAPIMSIPSNLQEVSCCKDMGVFVISKYGFM